MTSVYDFDFSSDKSNKFVPFVIGFLMYSVTIAIMSSFFTHSLTSGWEYSLNGRVTIEFQSNVDGADESLTDRQKEEIIKIVSSTQGIKSVKMLRETDILKILEPWLSSTAIPDDFPFPTIFDVEVYSDSRVDFLLLADKLTKISQGVRIHNHANWYAPIARISSGLFFFAIILSALIFATVCATVVFITIKTLGVHRNTVRILQLIGASNEYIASQFKRYYFFVGAKSSLISVLCSFATILLIGYVSSSEIIDISTVKRVLIAIIVPFITIILVMVTSKNTVLLFLRESKWTN